MTDERTNADLIAEVLRLEREEQIVFVKGYLSDKPELGTYAPELARRLQRADEAIEEAIRGGEHRSCLYGWCPFCGNPLDYHTEDAPFEKKDHADDCLAMPVLRVNSEPMPLTREEARDGA